MLPAVFKMDQSRQVVPAAFTVRLGTEPLSVHRSLSPGANLCIPSSDSGCCQAGFTGAESQSLLPIPYLRVHLLVTS